MITKTRVLSAVCIILAVAIAVQANMLHEEVAVAQNGYSGFNIFSHSIEDTGVAIRVRFRVLARREDGTRSWHYYGVTEAEVPPETYTESPLTEYSYVQFPRDFDELPMDGTYDQQIYSIGVDAGLFREGLKTSQ